MTRDLNRKISKIQYNSLNLPETITYIDGHKVMNTYDCLGRKVSVIYQVSVPSVTTPQADGSSVTSNYYRTYMRRSYSGNCIYRNDTLERILTTTGYITPEGEYHHYLKDYQGNNRIVLNESGQTIERTDYYPYGMSFSDSEHRQPYKYSGKELETMNGQRHLDYGARWMDYPVGRFTTIDRYCEKYYNLSPYLYCAGNPIMYIDPTGMEVWINDINYTIGMSYSGTDEFIKNTIMALNTIAECGGEELISDLVKSEKKYNYIKTTDANSYTKSLKDGNFEIGISSSLTDHSAFSSAVAHETMHGAQYEHGQGGRSIFNEVEAYVFSAGIGINTIFNGHPCQFQSASLSSSLNNQYSELFNFSFGELVRYGYNPTNMINAVRTFKIGASLNNTGLYNTYILYPNKPFDSLLRKYYKIY